jgi:hypothetical protein
MVTVFVGHMAGHLGLLGSGLGIQLMKFCASSFVGAFFLLSGYFWKDRGLSFLWSSRW